MWSQKYVGASGGQQGQLGQLATGPTVSGVCGCDGGRPLRGPQINQNVLSRTWVQAQFKPTNDFHKGGFDEVFTILRAISGYMKAFLMCQSM